MKAIRVAVLILNLVWLLWAGYLVSLAPYLTVTALLGLFGPAALGALIAVVVLFVPTRWPWFALIISIALLLQMSIAVVNLLDLPLYQQAACPLCKYFVSRFDMVLAYVDRGRLGRAAELFVNDLVLPLVIVVTVGLSVAAAFMSRGRKVST